MWLKKVKTGSLLHVSQDEFNGWPKERKDEFSKVEVVSIKNKKDGRTVNLLKSEWSKYGKAEQDEWEVVNEGKEILKTEAVGGTAADQQPTKEEPESGSEKGGK